MPSSLVRGRYVVARAVGRDGAEVLEDGAVFQRDGVIVEIGPSRGPRRTAPADEVLGSPDHVVLPGFVNGHHHVGLTPVPARLPRLPARAVVREPLAPAASTPTSTRSTPRSRCSSPASRPCSTCTAGGSGRAAACIEVADRVLKAYETSACACRTRTRSATRTGWPTRPTRRSCRALRRRRYPESSSPTCARRPSRSRTTSASSPTCGRSAAATRAPARASSSRRRTSTGARTRRSRRCATGRPSIEVGMHMHLVETAYQREYARRRTGRTAFRHLVDRGLAGPSLTLGHGVWLTEDDIELVAQTGTMICHNASSNLRLRSGVAPLNHWAARGVKVGDGPRRGRHQRRPRHAPGDAPRAAPAPRARHGRRRADVPAGASAWRPRTAPPPRRMRRAHRNARRRQGGRRRAAVRGAQIAHPYLDPDTSVVDAVVHRARSAASTS